MVAAVALGQIDQAADRAHRAARGSRSRAEPPVPAPQCAAAYRAAFTILSTASSSGSSMRATNRPRSAVTGAAPRSPSSSNRRAIPARSRLMRRHRYGRRGGFEHLPHHRQGHGTTRYSAIVVEHFVIQQRALAALHDEGQARLIYRRMHTVGTEPRISASGANAD